MPYSYISNTLIFYLLEYTITASSLKNCPEIFTEKGHDTFYYCLCEAENSQLPVTHKAAKRMKNEILEYEKENSTHFHLFQPQCIECDGNHSGASCLEKDHKRALREKKPPSPRECFAAANLLQKHICVIDCKEFVDDIQNLQGYIFSPTNRKENDSQPVYMLMSENGKSFRNIILNEQFPGKVINKNHKHCFGLRFANDFSVLFDDKVSNFEYIDLYGYLSLIFYGTENQQNRLLNLICNFELEEDNVDIFYKFTYSSFTEETKLKEKRKILKTHAEEVRIRSKCFGDGEFYALASVYNVDVIVDTSGRGEWKTFMTMLGGMFCFVSPVILKNNKQAEKDNDYRPYDLDLEECSCEKKKPEIQGHLWKIKGKVHEAVCMCLMQHTIFHKRITYNKFK